jgi:hypothetical protein
MIIECKACEALVDAEQVAVYEHHNPDLGPPGVFRFLKCPRCESPFITDEDKDDIFGDPYSLYPVQENVVNPNLPKLLQSSYGEATSCFKAKAYTATAIMCRKTLEGICAEHGVTGQNLVSALRQLKDQGIIENRLYEWADALRISGNEAAHDVNVTIAAEDARDILEFTNALLEYVFTFRDKFEAFKQRRSSRPRT